MTPTARRLLQFLCLFLIAASLLTLHAAAQEKDVPDFAAPVNATPAPDAPDWSQFVPGVPQQSHPAGSFYERCMLGSDPRITIPGDQEALCACMAAHQEELKKNAPAEQPWMQMIAKDELTPSQIFSEKIFAPCMYLEARDLALEECYSQTRFVILFQYQQDYDAYCGCYADNARYYMYNYAPPLIAAHIADPHESMVPANADPTEMVIGDYDYRSYMESRREECANRFGKRPSQ
jgi:hypothetical protein